MKNEVIVVTAENGQIVKVEQSAVFKSSDLYNRLILLTTRPIGSVFRLNFMRADGAQPKSRYMVSIGQMNYDGQTYHAFAYDLTAYQLAVSGVLLVSYLLQQDGVTIASGIFNIDVENSLPPNSDEMPTDENEFDRMIRILLSRTANVPNLVKSIQKVEGTNNAITYTDNSGVISAPIILGDPYAAPLPVNTASTLEIPASAWLPIEGAEGYTYTLTAAQHGQMRDGATARDLWVSFDEQGAEGFRGVVGEYTVSAAGDITVTVTERVSMTVRVWNGKSIVDETARNMIETETQRAEQTEAHLQEQITELQNTGVDTTAREQIAAETQRAESAEQALGESITAEQTRAEAAETLLGERIAAEQTRAEAAEETLQEQIASETARAKAEETSLGERIAAEQARAETAEAGLRDNLTEVTTNGVRNQKVAFTLNGTTLDITTS